MKPEASNPAPPPTGRAPRAPAIDPGEGLSVLSTLNDDGSRRWLRPRLSKGRFLTRRRAVGYLLIALFALLPLIHIRGRPIILLDIAAQRFHIFGGTFYPTDTLLLALLLVGVFIAIFWVTALLGRIWCGWACPQTVYMELLFRPIERLLEGAPGRARKGRIQTTALGKVLKHALYFLCSLALAHTFLAYFVSWDNLRLWVFGSPGDHIVGFTVVALVTGAMLFDFGYFREQVCLVACPYGRLQSVLLDRQSMIVRYDVRRGEPRGSTSTRKGDIPLPLLAESSADGAAPSNIGDCVDCRMCVTTCPTGIDIRKGLQMECVGCTQCIDACDAVMDKLHRARGLIRYSSQETMEGKRFTLLRPRVIIYPAVIAALFGAFVLVLANTGIADVTVLRGLGQTFQITPEGDVANGARIKVSNRLDRAAEFRFGVSGIPGAHLRPEESTVTVGAGQMLTAPARIFAPRAAFHGGRAQALITVTGPESFSRTIPFTLLGPAGESHDLHNAGDRP